MIKTDLQESIEKQYSRKYVHSLIKQELPELDLSPILSQLQDWTSQDHYPTKKEQLLSIDNWEEAIIHILSILLVTPKTTLTALVGQTATILKLPYLNAVKRTAELVYQMAVADLCDITPAYLDGEITVSNIFEVSPQLQRHLALTRFLPPLVCEPRDLRNHKDSAYLSVDVRPISKGFDYPEDICLDIINLSNKCAFSLDIPFLKAMEDEEQEEPRELTNELSVDLIHWGNEFFFSHFVDSRGRFYCHGYHHSYQGNSYRKAALNFTKTESIPLGNYQGIF